VLVRQNHHYPLPQVHLSPPLNEKSQTPFPSCSSALCTHVGAHLIKFRNAWAVPKRTPSCSAASCAAGSGAQQLRKKPMELADLQDRLVGITWGSHGLHAGITWGRESDGLHAGITWACGNHMGIPRAARRSCRDNDRTIWCRACHWRILVRSTPTLQRDARSRRECRLVR